MSDDTHGSADTTMMRTAFGALANLQALAHGQATQSSPNDFFFDAKKLTGTH